MVARRVRALVLLAALLTVPPLASSGPSIWEMVEDPSLICGSSINTDPARGCASTIRIEQLHCTPWPECVQVKEPANLIDLDAVSACTDLGTDVASLKAWLMWGAQECRAALLP